jgi:L-rhamnose isomerase
MQFGYKGGTLSNDDVVIRYNEIATLNSEDIIIGGSVGNKTLAIMVKHLIRKSHEGI